MRPQAPRLRINSEDVDNEQSSPAIIAPTSENDVETSSSQMSAQSTVLSSMNIKYDTSDISVL